MSSPFLQKIFQATQARLAITSEFMEKQNVVACGVGLKVAGGQILDEPCIVVSVTQKKPLDELDADDIVPRAVGEVVTDVFETGDIIPFGFNRRAILRPIRPGVSIGHRDGTAGTAGCIVRRGNQLFVLSNNHVLALLNRASIGDPILQPGPSDGGTVANVVGELSQYEPLYFLPQKQALQNSSVSSQDTPPSGWGGIFDFLRRLFGRGSSSQPSGPEISPSQRQNLIDAAIAYIHEQDAINPSIVDIGGPPLGIGQPRLGMRIVKSGRSTGLTQGLVTQIDVTVDVKYEGRPARFANQIMLTPLSERGDSGSLILDYERNAIALLFSGSDRVTVASPIETVLNRLRVELVTED